MGTKLSNFEENVLETIYTENVAELKQLLNAADSCGKALSTPLPYDEHGRSLLHLAAWSGELLRSDNPELLSAMLEKDPDVNIQDYYGWTPLMVSFYKGNIQSAYALLQKSAQFDTNTREAQWLLQHAVRHDFMATVSILLERSVKTTESPTSLLNIAVDNENVAMTRLLLDKGKCDPNAIDSMGWAPLHLASGHGNISLFKILIEFGADVNLKDKNGNTPLAWARQYESKPVQSELEKLQAVADNKWHEDENSSNEYPINIDYTENESAGDSEVNQEQDSSFPDVEEYIDEYRNELWSEVNQEIEAITSSEDVTMYGKGREYTDNKHSVQVHNEVDTIMHADRHSSEQPKSDQAAGNPQQNKRSSDNTTELKVIVNTEKSRANEHSEQPVGNAHTENAANMPAAAEITKSAEDMVKHDVNGKNDYNHTDDIASASSNETTHGDMKAATEDLHVGKDSKDEVLTAKNKLNAADKANEEQPSIN